MKSQFFLPIADGRIAFSTRLLSSRVSLCSTCAVSGASKAAGNRTLWPGPLHRASRRTAGRKIRPLPQRSTRGKERAMLARQSQVLTAALVKIDAWLERTPQTDQEGVGRRIGRALGKFPAAAAIIQATVQRDTAGRAIGLEIASAVEAGQKAHLQKDADLLRTNCEETDPAQLGAGISSSRRRKRHFAPPKAMGLRPVYHHKEDRVQAHLMVCSWRWPCGARSNNGCAPRVWAPVRGNSSSNSPE